VTSQNYFQLFDLPQTFALDPAVLESRWRTLAARVHPDRYVSATAVEKRMAMQWASTINEAYRVLKSPLQRARYLCELAGQDLQTESNTHMDGAFLMRQMEWREALDEARDDQSSQALEGLASELDQAAQDMHDTLAGLLDHDHDTVKAAQRIREWMFIEKLAAEIKSARHQLADQNH
jgi:molecular chaperone HscB